MTIGLWEKQDMLRRLAREMQTGSNGPLGNLIAGSRLEMVIEEAVSSLVKGNPHAIARALIRHLRERNFILCFAGGDSYAFVHRTFLEYYCADDLRVRFDYEKSIDVDFLKAQVFGLHWPDETWHEVLCLVAGMIHPSVLVNILEFLLAQHDPEQTCQHIFLAARCVGEVRKGSDLGDVADAVKRQLTELVKFDLYNKNWDSEARNQVTRIRTRVVTLRANIWQTDPETRRWLKARAQEEEEEEEEDLAVRQAAVQALAQGWKNDPETLPWLKACAQEDEDWAVRWAAVQALVRGWKDDPETLPWLKARAQEDGHSDVRQAAVGALARGWEDDPETLPWLKARAQEDESWAVRRAAVGELVWGWKDDPEVQALLQNLK